MSKHKETFYQPPFEGVPGHWVVQFYIDNNPFPEAAYFSSEEEAKDFEKEIKGKEKIDKGES